ncbi:hypothetical protein VCHE48_0683 [Vibrio cholerae HE48]|nr:hypothetical protein VCHE48_0683 [Vibrio cholerae HE48]
MDKFFSENGMLTLFKRNARIHANGSIPSTKNRQILDLNHKFVYIK